MIQLDQAAARAAFDARDRTQDGRFVVAVRTTRIYCKPSCPARRPRPDNVLFLPDGEAARAAGYRACLRCRPDEAGRDAVAVRDPGGFGLTAPEEVPCMVPGRSRHHSRPVAVLRCQDQSETRADGIGRVVRDRRGLILVDAATDLFGRLRQDTREIMIRTRAARRTSGGRSRSRLSGASARPTYRPSA